ncbi:hypothetical protein ACH5RR_032456 [Cinchona calisaya]|uniref:Uncharacterized protein n=1 Tax=Cinchona calisaya TaxID=153742 RepID=A0ABD2YI33_9GENT
MGCDAQSKRESTDPASQTSLSFDMSRKTVELKPPKYHYVPNSSSDNDDETADDGLALLIFSSTIIIGHCIFMCTFPNMSNLLILGFNYGSTILIVVINQENHG